MTAGAPAWAGSPRGPRRPPVWVHRAPGLPEGGGPHPRQRRVDHGAGGAGERGSCVC